jgi:hypothetical protein
MKYCKTHRRKTHRRKTHRRKTHRNIKKGGRDNQCLTYTNKLNEFVNRLQDATAATIVDLYEDIHATLRAAHAAGCHTEKQAIQDWEDAVFQPRMNELMRNGGGGCESLKARFEALKKRVHLMRMPTYENKWSRVRALYNNADRKGKNAECAELARAIDEFENTILKNETNKLMASQRR